MTNTWHDTVRNYIEILKPRETSLIVLIGACAAVLAGDGHPPLDRLVLVLVALLFASAGANGLTNYLDRHIDAKMQRTRHRVLPSKRIHPAEKVLPLILSLFIAGLSLAWYLHFFCFLAGLGGTLAAIVWRKRWTCVFPQGVLASCAPALAAWFAIRASPSWLLISLCLVIAIWVPLHLWSIMITWRDDYLGAGISFFPLNLKTDEAAKILVGLSLLLYSASIAACFISKSSWISVVMVNLMGIILVYTSIRLATSISSKRSWRLYKLSAFPYMGLVFMAMCLDTLVRG
ncbi:MAG: UbiA family prenyltransferase [Dehalococcoidales bacterium]|nr:MAG: UbiA family prenyltransferase [Dehalococcoidales bacterium]